MKKDFRSAFWYGYSCWEEIRECFDDLDSDKQGFCLKLLYQTGLTMSESLIESKKHEEAAIYLKKIKENFYDISTFEDYPSSTRKISSFYMKKTEKEYFKVIQ